jgi:AcrR family transcriptional regulator
MVDRDRIDDALCELFRRTGYDGASLSYIADATGLGRSSLYHHYPGGKDDMVRAALRRLGPAVDRDLIAPLRGPGSVAERLRAWVRGLARFYAHGRKGCLIGALALGGGDERFAAEIAAALRAVIDALAATLAEAGIRRADARRRAEVAIARVQGALVVARGLGDPAVFGRAVRSLPADLLVDR